MIVSDEYPTTDVVVGGLAQDAGPAFSPPAGLESAAGTSFTLATPSGRARLHTPLVGVHQATNAAVAVAMLDAAGPPFARGLTDIAAAIEQVQLPGRFQRYGSYIFDVAHNPGWRGCPGGDDARGTAADTGRRTCSPCWWTRIGAA